MKEVCFLNGTGLFETMRSFNGKIVYFKEHLERIRRSSGLVRIKFPYSPVQLKKIIAQTLALDKFRDAYVRLTIRKTETGTGILVIVRRYRPFPEQKYKKGFSAVVAKMRQRDNILAQLKTTNRALYETAYQEAKQKGFDEAILLNNYGNIAEATRSNIFWVKDKKLFTPDLSCGCLDGITRKIIFVIAKKQKMKICTGKFTLRDLYAADEAFLTNSLIGVMSLASLGGKNIGKDKCRKITTRFIREYRCLLK